MATSALGELLRSKRLKITPQRLEVLRALEKVPDHPCAEAIYHVVKRRCPSMSLATVYKTLDTLVTIGELRVALVSHGKARYDTRLDAHHHFLCTQCGYIEDINVGLDCLDACLTNTLRAVHHIHRSEVVFRGLCQSCFDRKSNQLIECEA